MVRECFTSGLIGEEISASLSSLSFYELLLYQNRLQN